MEDTDQIGVFQAFNEYGDLMAKVFLPCVSQLYLDPFFISEYRTIVRIYVSLYYFYNIT